MGLIKAIKDATGSYFGDQWLEFFSCDSISSDVLMVKGEKVVNNGRNSNTKASDNIINNGSIIAVNEGQCMIIVEQGAIVDFCAEAGEFRYDASTEPSLFYGNLGENLLNTFKTIGKRFTFGGNTAKDQRVYYINTKEIRNNLFGTASPIPIHVSYPNINLELDIRVRCHGQYSFKISDPLKFYKEIAGNVTSEFKKTEIAEMMKSEFLTALQPAIGKVSRQGVGYFEVTNMTVELSQAMNEELTYLWTEKRGIEVVSVGVTSIKATEEDEKLIQEAQTTGMYTNAAMQQAMLASSRARAMEKAAENEGGAFIGLAGMNMTDMIGGNAMNAAMMNQQMMMQQQQMQQQQMQQMQQMQQQQTMGAVAGAAVATGAPVLGWTCSCGKEDNRGKFCMECGSKKPEGAGWTCSCGTVNQGKFCPECGSKKPEGAPLYKCDKCQFEPEDPANPPKFCPNCGDIFDENDIK